MSSQRRTAEFQTIKVRGLRWQNPDGSLPVADSVLVTHDSVTGIAGWSRDLYLNSLDVSSANVNALSAVTLDVSSAIVDALSAVTLDVSSANINALSAVTLDVSSAIVDALSAVTLDVSSANVNALSAVVANVNYLDVSSAMINALNLGSLDVSCARIDSSCTVKAQMVMMDVSSGLINELYAPNAWIVCAAVGTIEASSAIIDTLSAETVQITQLNIGDSSLYQAGTDLIYQNSSTDLSFNAMGWYPKLDISGSIVLVDISALVFEVQEPGARDAITELGKIINRLLTLFDQRKIFIAVRPPFYPNFHFQSKTSLSIVDQIGALHILTIDASSAPISIDRLTALVNEAFPSLLQMDYNYTDNTIALNIRAGQTLQFTDDPSGNYGTTSRFLAFLNIAGISLSYPGYGTFPYTSEVFVSAPIYVDVSASVPAPPMDLSAEMVTSYTAWLTWADVAGATHYGIQCLSPPSYAGAWDIIDISGIHGSSHYIIDGLEGQKTYMFTVTALNSLNESPASSPVTFHTPESVTPGPGYINAFQLQTWLSSAPRLEFPSTVISTNSIDYGSVVGMTRDISAADIILTNPNFNIQKITFTLFSIMDLTDVEIGVNVTDGVYLDICGHTYINQWRSCAGDTVWAKRDSKNHPFTFHANTPYIFTILLGSFQFNNSFNFNIFFKFLRLSIDLSAVIPGLSGPWPTVCDTIDSYLNQDDPAFGIDNNGNSYQSIRTFSRYQCQTKLNGIWSTSGECSIGGGIPGTWSSRLATLDLNVRAYGPAASIYPLCFVLPPI